MSEKDIWEGFSIKKNPSEKVSDYYVQSMINASRNRSESSGDFALTIKIGFMVVVFFVLLVASMYGPSMFHNALVVCEGNKCTTYTEWKVINESKTGVLEVWAGGRLQRFSNGTWRYE